MWIFAGTCTTLVRLLVAVCAILHVSVRITITPIPFCFLLFYIDSSAGV